MTAKISQIATKLHPDAEKIAQRLEELAADIRSGKRPTKAIWYIHIEPDDTWREGLIGNTWVSLLIGYIERAKFTLLKRQYDKDEGL